MSFGEVTIIHVPNDIFNYLINHLGDHTIMNIPDVGMTYQLFGCVGTDDIYYNILMVENDSPTIMSYIRFISE